MRELPEHIASIICACAKRVGVETAQALAVASLAVDQITQQIGGERIYWPRTTAEKAARDAHIAELAGAGLTHQEIAERLGISRGRVSQILSR